MRTEIRTFVAIKIEPEKKLLDQLSKFEILFNDERINWVSAKNFHLTLRFIGNTTREQLYELVDSFEEISVKLPSFQTSVKGPGYFKSKGNPKVLFVKVAESDALSNLVKIVEENVVATGFHAELKPFKPHLTLGRIKFINNRNRFFSIIDEIGDIHFQDVNVTEFILYQSILKPEGPEYKIIRKFALI